MPDLEKVMQWLKTCANGCEDGCPYEYKNLVYRVECKADLMSDALELLREQEPIRLVKQIEQTEWTVCGNCRNHMISKWIFCPYCGRTVKRDATD